MKGNLDRQLKMKLIKIATTLIIITWNTAVYGSNSDEVKNLRANSLQDYQENEKEQRMLDPKTRVSKKPLTEADSSSWPNWAIMDSSVSDEEERRVFITYEKSNKSKIKQNMKALDQLEGISLQTIGDNTNAQNPTFQIKYEFDDMDTLVVSASQKKLKQLMEEFGDGILRVEDDPKRQFLPVFLEYNTQEVKEYPDAEGSNLRSLQTTFQDKLIGNQWLPYGVQMVQAPILWNGVDGEAPVTGNGVKVCVIDSGIYSQSPDFILANLSGDETSSTIKWNVDTCKHGTHVSGTIAGANNQVGVVGVAYNAKIHIVRVLSGGSDGCGWSYASGIIAAVEECQRAGANVISMSLGGSGQSTNEADKFKSLFEEFGILSVAAAGNGGNSNFGGSDYYYPASYPSVMSVAAVNNVTLRAPFSQYNDQVDIAAPGVSTISVNSGDTTGNNVLTLSGTSMATPHVAGVAALLIERFPDHSVADIRNSLERTALDRGTPGRDNYYGHGIVNAFSAYKCLASNACNISSPIVPCRDSPESWHDSDGIDFNCTWYGQEDNCEKYGDNFANQGKTAKAACCVCGGGDHLDVSVPNSPSYVPSFVPSSSPSVKPSSRPSSKPSLLPAVSPATGENNDIPGQEWADIEVEGFESGWGAWKGGGNDARRSGSDSAYAHSGRYSIRLRDDTKTSYIQRNVLNIEHYSKIEISFWVYIRSLESTDAFAVESLLPNQSWTTLRRYQRTGGVYIPNNKYFHDSILIDTSQMSSITFRFRCYADQDSDRIYIDDVVIKGLK